jgi:hypothetical protein
MLSLSRTMALSFRGQKWNAPAASLADLTNQLEAMTREQLFERIWIDPARVERRAAVLGHSSPRMAEAGRIFLPRGVERTAVGPCALHALPQNVAALSSSPTSAPSVSKAHGVCSKRFSFIRTSLSRSGGSDPIAPLITVSLSVTSLSARTTDGTFSPVCFQPG